MPNLAQMLGSIPEVQAGQSFEDVLTAKRINAIQGLLRALVVGENIGSGVGVRKISMGAGFILSSTAKGGGSTTIEHPFKLSASVVSGTPDEVYAEVVYGTVNDFEPTGLYPATDHQLTDNATNYVWLRADLDDAGDVTGAEVLVDNSPIADTDYEAFILLGTVVVTDLTVTSVNQAVTHSLRFGTCGRVAEVGPGFAAGTYHFWAV